MPSGPRCSDLFRSFILVLLIFLMQPCQASAQQESVTQGTDISQAGIEKLLQDLEDPQRLQALKQDLRTLLAVQDSGITPESGAEPRGLVGHLLSAISGYMHEINQVMSEAGQNVLQIPSLMVDLAEQGRDPQVLRSWGEMAGKIMLVLLAGMLAQLVVFRILSRARRSLADQDAYNKAVRILLLAGNTLLELFPIAAFAAAAYGILPLLDPRAGTQLVALTLINANVLVRLVMVFTRLVLVPDNPALRLLPLDNESVHYLYIWGRRVVRIGIYGYFLLEAALILGLPDSLYFFCIKLLGLIITLMAVMLIMQNRGDVASWLRGDQTPPYPDQLFEPDPDKAVAGKIQAVSMLRRRLADFWHIGAIVITLGMFGTWAMEIQGGFHYLARAIIMTVMVMALISFLIRMSQRGLDHLFKISDELKRDLPGLEARANRYLPLLRHSVRMVLYIVAAFSIMQAWGLGTLSWLISPQGGAILSNIVVIILIIATSFLIWELVSLKVESYLTREREGVPGRKANTRLLTLLPLVSNVVRIALVLVAGMSVLAHLGINIAPLLAGAGVIGLAIGFGAQTLVRDVITGAFILMEDSIAVGDWVEAGGYAGTVEHLTIRTLTLRDLSGAVFVIPFGDVTTVKNNNRDYGYALVDAGVAYRESYGEAVQALQDVAAELRQDETWQKDIIGDLEVFGLNNLADSAVEIRVRLKTMPGRQFSVRRAFLERMKRIFDERGIEIPFPHQTIWFGVDKDGSAPPMRVLRDPGRSSTDVKSIETNSESSREEKEIEYFSESDDAREIMQSRDDELTAQETEGKAGQKI
jgi:moderate conductance mechanosensitive channel